MERVGAIDEISDDGRVEFHGRTEDQGRKYGCTTSVHLEISNPPHRAHSSPRASAPPWLVRPMGGLTPIGAIQ